MAISKVIARGRTRGKNPQEFTFEAIGRLVPRFVQAKDGNDMVVDKDGKPYVYLTDDGKLTEDATAKGFTVSEDKVLVGEGYRFVEVDDVAVDGIIDANAQDAIPTLLALFDNNLQAVVDGALIYFNETARDKAAPKAEAKPDMLGPVVEFLKAEKFLTDAKEAVWRRSVTVGATSLDMTPADFALMTKEYKAALKAGKSLPTVAA